MTESVFDHKRSNLEPWPVVGHEGAVTLLRRAIAEKRLVHAYLLSGPAAIGKTTLARAFAQTLNCTNTVRPCGACRACRKIQSNTHPDVHVISGEGGSLKIDQIRLLQREVNLLPFEGHYRVILIRRFEEATREAANALLKILEEPPSKVILILTALEADELLPTVLSRCQHIPLRPVPYTQVREALKDRGHVPDDQVELLARLCNGRLGWGIRASQDPAILNSRKQILERQENLLHASRLERLSLAEQLAKKPDQLPELLALWRGWWRDALLLRCEYAQGITNPDQRQGLEAAAAAFSVDQILGALRQIQTTRGYLDQNANARLALENLFMDLPHQ